MSYEFIKSEAHNLIGINYSAIRSNASASELLTISPAGVISANAIGTYIIASPRIFYSNEQISQAGQIIWGNAIISLLFKPLIQCQIEAGVASKPINGLSKFSGSSAPATGIGNIALAQAYVQAFANPGVIEREMYPALKIIIPAANTPIAEIYSLEAEWFTADLSCGGGT